MKGKAILVAVLVAGAALAVTVPAEARGGFHVGFGFGWGTPAYHSFGSYYYGGYNPYYRPYRTWAPPYYYNSASVVAYPAAPYRYRVYRKYNAPPRVYYRNREYDNYSPRVYYRR